MKKLSTLMAVALCASAVAAPALAGGGRGPQPDRGILLAQYDEVSAVEVIKRLKALEGAWLFDAAETSKQLHTSSDTESARDKLKNKLELQYGNQVMEIKVTAPNTLRIRMYNRYDEPDAENTFETQVKYVSHRDYFQADNLGLFAIREGVLAFQPGHSELGLLYRRMK